MRLPILYKRGRLTELFHKVTEGLDMTDEDYERVKTLMLSVDMSGNSGLAEAQAICDSYKRKRKNSEE